MMSFPLSFPILFAFLAAATYAILQLMPSGEDRALSARLGLEGVEADEVSPLVTSLKPFLALMRPMVAWLGLEEYRTWVERKFINAGMAGVMNTDEFLAYKLLMAGFFWALFVGLFGMLIVGTFAPIPIQVVVVAAGSFFPDAWITGQVSDRQSSIRRELPYVMDLLTLSVEAGLDFVAGISKVCEKAHAGPLVDELAFFLTEMRMGASRQQALRNLADRVDMPEVRSFSAMLVQADILGASVGPVLRAQSDLIRTQRFQRAERMGAYASQKILFPLILCIMPAVFVMIFGPIVLNFIYGDQVIGI
ncbi:MAG: type II secretion system F family protein [Alphaproteobacteria bacterium]|nr:type II secretion system F family protein [Alphaproteobacteria bacterium]MCB9794112.1 type II secretion system F family protein [Alphaproteobacteria bacterium]